MTTIQYSYLAKMRLTIGTMLIGVTLVALATLFTDFQVGREGVFLFLVILGINFVLDLRNKKYFTDISFDEYGVYLNGQKVKWQDFIDIEIFGPNVRNARREVNDKFFYSSGVLLCTRTFDFPVFSFGSNYSVFTEHIDRYFHGKNKKH